MTTVIRNSNAKINDCFAFIEIQQVVTTVQCDKITHYCWEMKILVDCKMEWNVRVCSSIVLKVCNLCTVVPELSLPLIRFGLFALCVYALTVQVANIYNMCAFLCCNYTNVIKLNVLIFIAHTKHSYANTHTLRTRTKHT